MDFIERQSEQFPRDNRPLPETDSPEVSGVTFSNSEGITTKESSRKDCLELTQHVTEYQAELGQVPPVVRVLVKKLLLSWKIKS